MDREISRAGESADFVLSLPSDRPAHILQVTDTQIIDSSQQRYAGRLSAEETRFWAPENVYERMTKYLDGAVRAASPDLIVHTGDFVYGEFDDSGRMLDFHISLMEKYNVPWTLALGNHERETLLGTEELCRRLEKSPNCLFRAEKSFGGARLEGNGNFAVLLQRGGEPAAVLYLLDSGVGDEKLPCGIHAVQRAWMRAVHANYPSLPAFAYFHIGPLATLKAAARHGYSFENFVPFELHGEEFGYWGSKIYEQHCIDGDGSLMELFREIGVAGVFCGHFHTLSTSLMYEGIRLTYGLKTGEYDSHIGGRLGGTLMSFPAAGKEGFSVRHIVIG